jgi:rhodanese-related sulfurtransferase
MAPFPLPLSEILGHWGQYVVYLLIGIAFGAVLELAGFGNSKKLAAQFYFTDLTVLKVMFTAIVVAMVLIFAASAVGLLDYNLIWVNHTYIWPGIVGGLIMGVGFILGGFCPGTSLVAATTGKIDGMFFVLGALFGIFTFGETVGLYENFWHSSYLGRFTIPEWLGLPAGVVVLLVVLMALFMFWGAEQLERIFGKKDPKAAPRWRYGAAGALVLLAVVVMFVGQPTTDDRWARIAGDKEAALDARDVQIHPGELLALIYDTKVKVMMFDVRAETDYNLFHIEDVRRVSLDQIPDLVPELNAQPGNTVFVLMSNDEEAATEAWRTLVAESVPNVYILEGGVNNWIATFADEEFASTSLVASVPDDRLAYNFDVALGARYPFAGPDPHKYELEFEPKVKLEIKRGPLGSGCGK